MECLYEINRTECYKIWAVLEKYYKRYNSCNRCNIFEGLLFIIEKWDTLDETEQCKIKEIFKIFGFNNVYSPPNDDKNNFKCPILNKHIYVPCELYSCDFYINYKYTKNCILNYLLKQNKTSLQFNELAYLLQIPIETLETIYVGAINSIQRKLLNDTMDVSRFVYYQTDKICAVCECNVDQYLARNNLLYLTSDLIIEELGLVYCSMQCKRAKPVALIQLEFEFETSLFNILKHALRLYQKDIKKISEVLNISQWLVKYAISRYLPKKYH